jgi:hypothetical protein
VSNNDDEEIDRKRGRTTMRMQSKRSNQTKDEGSREQEVGREGLEGRRVGGRDDCGAIGILTEQLLLLIIEAETSQRAQLLPLSE